MHLATRDISGKTDIFLHTMSLMQWKQLKHILIQPKRDISSTGYGHLYKGIRRKFLFCTVKSTIDGTGFANSVETSSAILLCTVQSYVGVNCLILTCYRGYMLLNKHQLLLHTCTTLFSCKIQTCIYFTLFRQKLSYFRFRRLVYILLSVTLSMLC